MGFRVRIRVCIVVVRVMVRVRGVPRARRAGWVRGMVRVRVWVRVGCRPAHSRATGGKQEIAR